MREGKRGPLWGIGSGISEGREGGSKPQGHMKLLMMDGPEKVHKGLN